MIGIERMAAAYLFLNKGSFNAIAAPKRPFRFPPKTRQSPVV